MPKQVEPDFIPGQDILTQSELMQRAAALIGLEIGQEDKTRSITKAFATFELDQAKLKALEERGIKRQERPDCDVFTLIDTNPQDPPPHGFALSNYWNFSRTERDKGPFDLKIELKVQLVVDQSKRGIVCTPLASGTLVSPCDHLPNFRMFKALVELSPDMPDVAKRIAANELGRVVISWTDLGLGGLREIGDLFREFARGNQAIHELSSKTSIFQPSPLHSAYAPGNTEQYVVEPAQPRLFRLWHQQLDNYRDKIYLL